MTSEQREQEIRERWRKATAIPWGMVSFTESGFQSPLDRGLIDISIWSASREAYDALYVVPEDIQYLLDEVTYLRGQLSDLCEDSRAAAEVVRLRKIIREIRGYVEDCQKAYERYVPLNGIHASLAHLHKMASGGSGSQGDCATS